METQTVNAEEPGSARWLLRHGIDPQVWAERGVVRYAAGDLDFVRAQFNPFKLSPGHKGSLTKVVNAVTRGIEDVEDGIPIGGLILPKSALPGHPSVPPQIRPDHSVVRDFRSTWHRHTPPPDSYRWAMAKWHRDPNRRQAAKPQNYWLEEKSLKDHLKKYGPHGEDGAFHSHEPEGAKYFLYGGVSRVDFPVRSQHLLATSKEVYLALEGVLKTDALLSQNVPVFGVPSVTVWSSREFAWMAEKLLQGKTLYIVPDSPDFEANPWVRLNALYVRELFRWEGVDAHVLVPPEVPELKARGEKTGADDALGAGSTLEDFQPTGPYAPLEKISQALWSGVDPRRRRRLLRGLCGLSVHADEDGIIASQDLKTLARMMGDHWERHRGWKVQKEPKTLEALRDLLILQEAGLLELVEAPSTGCRRSLSRGMAATSSAGSGLIRPLSGFPPISAQNCTVEPKCGLVA